MDEADLVLSFGYDADVKAVAAAVPAGCQSMLMSATLTSEVDALKGQMLHNPVLVKVEDGDATTEGNLKQFYVKYVRRLLLFFVLGFAYCVTCNIAYCCFV